MKSEAKNLCKLGIFIALICCFMFGPNIIKGIPVTYGTDLKPEQFFFNMEFTQLMNQFFDSGILPFYSWSLFLGNNFYASQTFYIFGDLFTWLSLLIQNINFFDRTLILEILKFFVAGYAMYYLLSQFQYSTKVKITGALCYAFSAWALFFSGQLMFHSFYCFVPLYFAGIERYLRKDNIFLFLFSTSLLLLSHWYLFYSLSFFTPLYYIYRYSVFHGNFKKFFPRTLKLIGVYLLGVSLCAILLLPTLFYMMGNDRVGLIPDLFFQEHQVYFHFFAALFSPNYLYIYGDNIFETHWHVTRELCLWSGAVTSLLLPQLPFFKDRHFRKNTMILYVILILILGTSLGNTAMHGFSEPSFRWTFLLILMNILTVSHLLEHKDQLNLKILKISSLVLGLVCVSIIPITALCSGKISELISGYGNQWIMFCLSAIPILVIACILCRSVQKDLTLILGITLMEFALNGSVLYISKMDTSEKGTYEFIDRVTHVLQDEPGELTNTLNYLDPAGYQQYYRIYVPHESLYWSYSHNMAINYQIHGLMNYDSTYSPSINKLADIAPQITEFNSDMIFNIKDPDLLQFLNVKFAIVTDENELPNGIDWKLIQNDYRGSIKIYQNSHYRSLGTTYSEIMSYSDFTHHNESLQRLSDTILSEDPDYIEIKSYLKSDSRSSLENVVYGGNQLTGYCYSQSDSFMVLTLPYDPGWKVMNNGNPIRTYNVNGGFIGIPINAGDNNISMYFMPEGFKLGAIISGSAMVFTLILFCFPVFRKGRKHTGQS